jgi:hypothetical protein
MANMNVAHRQTDGSCRRPAARSGVVPQRQDDTSSRVKDFDR